MHTVLNPLLLAALLAPTDRKGNPASALVTLAGPFSEPAPKHPELPEAAEKVLRAFINMEEVSEGWGNESDSDLLAAIQKRATKLNLRPNGATWEEAALILRELGDKYIADWQAYDAVYSAYADRARIHALTAPRIAYAQALLAQVPGFVQVPDEGLELWAQAMQQWQQSVQPAVLTSFGPLEGAALAQALGRTDRKPAAPAHPSLFEYAEQWNATEMARREAETARRDNNLAAFLQYAQERFREDFGPFLLAAEAEGIEGKLILGPNPTDRIRTGRGEWHDAEIMVRFTVGPERPDAKRNEQPAAEIYYRTPQLQLWKDWQAGEGSKPAGSWRGSGGGNWYSLRSANERAQADAAEALGALAALFRGRLLGQEPLPAEQPDENRDTF